MITGTFTFFGYKTDEINLTPILGVMFIIAIVLLIGATTWGV